MGIDARIVALPGDGIGPEVTAAALDVLLDVATRFGHRLHVEERAIGARAYRDLGTPLPAETLAACLAADAVFLGAVGDPSLDAIPADRRPEAGLLGLRKAMGVFANIRPARTLPTLEDAGPLRPDRAKGIDLLIVRELTGGLYFGTPRSIDVTAGTAVDTLPYTREEIERVADVAFRLAKGRRGLVTSVDKANVLATSRLWRVVVDEVAPKHPGVRHEHQLVDSAAMLLVQDPGRFDVMLTENLFGDILSDEAGALVGSLGLLPSASLGTGPGLFEPVHGSAPTLAGKDLANPIGAILTAAMLLRDGLRLDEEAALIERAVEKAVASGARTADLAAKGTPALGTRAMTAAVRTAIA